MTVTTKRFGSGANEFTITTGDNIELDAGSRDPNNHRLEVQGTSAPKNYIYGNSQAEKIIGRDTAEQIHTGGRTGAAFADGSVAAMNAKLNEPGALSAAKVQAALRELKIFEKAADGDLAYGNGGADIISDTNADPRNGAEVLEGGYTVQLPAIESDKIYGGPGADWIETGAGSDIADAGEPGAQPDTRNDTSNDLIFSNGGDGAVLSADGSNGQEVPVGSDGVRVSAGYDAARQAAISGTNGFNAVKTFYGLPSDATLGDLLATQDMQRTIQVNNQSVPVTYNLHNPGTKVTFDATSIQADPATNKVYTRMSNAATNVSAQFKAGGAPVVAESFNGASDETFAVSTTPRANASQAPDIVHFGEGSNQRPIVSGNSTATRAEIKVTNKYGDKADVEITTFNGAAVERVTKAFGVTSVDIDRAGSNNDQSLKPTQLPAVGGTLSVNLK